MKTAISLVLIFGLIGSVDAEEFSLENFAQEYFDAWTATQHPTATKEDIEQYLSLLTDDVGHQHLPYDPDDTRSSEGKKNMREGMNYYLGVHTEYEGKLIGHMTGHNVIVIKYKTSLKGIHPQTKQVIVDNHLTLEVLEIEHGKVAVIRKYSE